MLRFGSGVYNLRDSEGPSTYKPQVIGNGTELACSIFFLDDTEHKFFVSKNATGQELLQKVYEFLELTEHDFFGLQFVCVTGSNTVRLKWLDAKKSIKRQMMCPPYHLFFRLKFYVSDPGKLQEEYTRYLVYLQLRKDLLDGRLPCTDEMAITLGGLAAQSELGDYNEEEHDEDYLSNFRLVPVQGKLLNKKIKESHQLNKGMYPAKAEFEFLNKAKCLDFYGFDLYEAKDGYDRQITIGVNSNGVSVFDNGSRVHSFPWATIIKVSFKRKNFLLHIMMSKENDEQVDTELSFNSVTSQNCKMLWKSCIEHHTFFRLAVPPSNSAKSVFHLGSRFRYSGRTEHQTLEEARKVSKPDRQFQRVPLSHNEQIHDDMGMAHGGMGMTHGDMGMAHGEMNAIHGDIDQIGYQMDQADDHGNQLHGTMMDSAARTDKTPLTHSTTSGSSIPNSQSSTREITTGQQSSRRGGRMESVRRRTSSLIRDNIRRKFTQMGEFSSSAGSILHSLLAMSQNSFKISGDSDGLKSRDRSKNGRDERERSKNGSDERDHEKSGGEERNRPKNGDYDKDDGQMHEENDVKYNGELSAKDNIKNSDKNRLKNGEKLKNSTNNDQTKNFDADDEFFIDLDRDEDETAKNGIHRTDDSNVDLLGDFQDSTPVGPKVMGKNESHSRDNGVNVQIGQNCNENNAEMYQKADRSVVNGLKNDDKAKNGRKVHGILQNDEKYENNDEKFYKNFKELQKLDDSSTIPPDPGSNGSDPEVLIHLDVESYKKCPLDFEYDHLNGSYSRVQGDNDYKKLQNTNSYNKMAENDEIDDDSVASYSELSNGYAELAKVEDVREYLNNGVEMPVSTYHIHTLHETVIPNIYDDTVKPKIDGTVKKGKVRHGLKDGGGIAASESSTDLLRASESLSELGKASGSLIELQKALESEHDGMKTDEIT
ncbi:unnamed protein product [Bursaphelenchus okinawaensis]|uniref:Moesin/ezrin/radixin homolog 1 n=1 Tax=Bursaphelenchus okinawaensis TaxID=465554 RepID=A0A811KPW8_9BILA|nr:unnamed protein product [Bursaphelenchus okinawaensis]CAG9108295.1 unnamed protein product [Bursaphelenchus okinawaensis]